MSAILAPRCGKPMRRGRPCFRPAGHLGRHQGEASVKLEQERRDRHRRDAVYAIRTHGYVGYTRGCRCDTCKAAKAAYIAGKRAAAAASARPGVAVSGVTHGTRFAYEERGCRCVWCCEHYAAVGHGHRAKVQVSA